MTSIDEKLGISDQHCEDVPVPISASFEGMNDEEMRGLEKRLVRKIDFHLISALFFLFIFNILDRSNIASARLGTLEKDLGLTDTQYQTAVAIMFAGYMSGQIPSNIILTRVRPSRYIPVAILLWGTISICTAAVKTVPQIMAIRVLLGLAESPFFAAALLLMSSWYLPSEMAPRVAIMYCGNTVANGFGGLIAAGILSRLDGAGGVAGWRWLYIIEGGGTIITGLISFFFLPDFPRSGQTKWLSDQEQRFAEWRLARHANDEVDENGGILAGLKDAFSDPKTWILALLQICLLSAQTWTYFFPTIVSSLGFNSTVTLLITAPVYFFGFFTSLFNSFLAQKTNKRAILISWPLVVDIIGNIMVISSSKTAVRYTGMFLMCAGSYSAFNVIQAWIASTIPRTRTKRGIVFAFVNVCGSFTNIYGAYFFPTKDSPHFRNGGIALSSFAAAGIVVAFSLGFMLHRLNKKAGEEEERIGVPQYKYLW
ncbi:major facilitator superfamily domain-containing protein [Xylariales sp. PMI_506]|nr:major facilitator superfamily domain-containing protein [Xylariales sp. PMI_506]